jgi:DNA-binding transcriptional ArsR family regulator
MNRISEDDVFKALADPNRRRILDLAKARPGITVSELAESFEFTRYAVMKHLRVLENAGLIVPRRAGRKKELHLNAIPIQTIYDRWISQYSALWASSLTSLKYQLEKEETMTSPSPKQVYVLYIRTSADKLWNAITDPELTLQYFHNTEVQSEFSKGSTIDYMITGEDGQKKSAVTGKIVEVEPKRRLVHSFGFEGKDDPPSTVSYDVEEMGDVVKLTLIHEFESEDETFKGTSEGWPSILSGLKTLLETGEPLPKPDPNC